MGLSRYEVEWTNGTVELPATGRESGGAAISSWQDAAPRVQRYIKAQHDTDPHHRERGTVPVVLIPRPDNNYNNLAVSVAARREFGQNLDDRHLGYLYDRFLWKVGQTNLPRLAQYSRMEIAATAIVTGRGGDRELVLDVPDADPLREAIETFLAHADIHLSHLAVEVAHPTTDNALRQIATFGSDPQPVRALGLHTVRSSSSRPVALQIVNVQASRPIGTVTSGLLFLDDERQRDEVLALLAEEGVRVAPPFPPSDQDTLGSAAGEQAPNLRAEHAVSGIDIYAPGARTPLAQYNPTTKVMWVEDRKLEPVCRRYAARLGVPVVDVRSPSWPWRLQEETQASDRHDHKLLQRHHVVSTVPADVVRSAAALVPDDLFANYDIRLVDDGTTLRSEPHPEALLYEALVAERQALFGRHEPSSEIAACRLCRHPALVFATPISTAPLAYCQPCLQHATNGVIDDRSRAAHALRLLGDHEFTGPMLEPQLATLHVNPDEPMAPPCIDRLLLLRFAIRRGAWPWTHLLEEAGFAENGLRLVRGTLMRARDGHLCLSMRERAVDDFLHLHEIGHEREPAYPADPDFNASGRRRADWLLEDGTLVELWGLPNDPKYAAKMREKEQLAARHGLRLIGITDADLPKLPAVFAPWLADGVVGPTTWRWSPVLISKPKEPQPPSMFDPAAPGNSARNAELRRSRLGRCREAVDLQQAGLSRSRIAAELGINAETVKLLLRDGKFYADPDTDVHRMSLARAAAEAITAGMTKGQFKEKHRLTGAKAAQSWKDADVLFPRDGSVHDEPRYAR